MITTKKTVLWNKAKIPMYSLWLYTIEKAMYYQIFMQPFAM